MKEFWKQDFIISLLFFLIQLKNIIGGYTDDVIAVDNIQIQDKPCETNYFKIQDFSKLLSKTAVGEKVFGPILYDDEGYAFRVFVSLF